MPPLSRGGFSCFVLLWRHGSVAQWIEQLRPKEKVVRSTRARATNSESESEDGSFLLLITEKRGLKSSVSNFRSIISKT